LVRGAIDTGAISTGVIGTGAIGTETIGTGAIVRVVTVQGAIGTRENWYGEQSSGRLLVGRQLS